MQRVRIDGVTLELQRLTGVGQRSLSPIVFLHEGLGSVAMWREWPAQVCAATGRDGVVYSRRGYGESDPVANVRTTGRLAPDYLHREALEVLPQLLLELNIERPVLLGHSDGGSIALLHAAHFPVGACVVMAPHVVVEDMSVRAIDKARLAYEAGDLRARLRHYHRDVDGAFWQWNDIWLDPRFRAFDIRADCRRISAPVLAIQGLQDPYGSLRQIEEIAPTQGIFETATPDGCGHSPHKDQPEQTLERIVRFLAEPA